MPQFRLNVSIEHKGALLNAAESQAAGKRMVIAVNEILAQESYNRIQARLRNVLRNPTGYYQRKITLVSRTVYRGVSDGGVVYGGWLEGTSSRNRTTRFPGYRTFRTVKDEIDREKVKIVQPAIDKFIAEMNR